MTKRKVLLGIVYPVVVVVAGVALASRGGWHLLWLLFVPYALREAYRVFRPAPPRPAAARYTEPGSHRVVLQVTGRREIQVIRELRETTAAPLLEAQQMAAAAPVVVVEGVSEQSAELIAERLRSAGARAVVSPLDDLLDEPEDPVNPVNPADPAVGA